MSLDSLLLWLSAKCKGSWSQFRAAVEELHLSGNAGDGGDGDAGSSRDGFPIYRQAQFALNVLCHVEFSTENAWRIVPPVIAAVEQADGKVLGILCGARTPSLLQKLQAQGGFQYEATGSSEMLERVGLIVDGIDVLKSVASSLDVFLQESAPLALLLATPAVDSRYSWRLMEMPQDPWLGRPPLLS